MALLTLIVTQIATSARTESRIALNLRRGLELQAAADGAVHLAAFRLLDRSERGWNAHAMPGPHRLVLDGAEVELRLVDQSDLVNINTALPDMLEALFVAAGVDAGRAASLAQAVMMWREKTLAEPVQARRDAAYRAAGRSYLPPSAPFRSIDELGLVLGMSNDVVARLAPHVSLHAHYGPAENTADPLALAALTRLHRTTGYLPAPRVAGEPFVVQIAAVARGADNATATRHAILQLDPQAAETPLTVLEWN